MSAFDCSCDHFQRLEDFPAYTSVIKCFGKPIIPPLLTPKERLKISQLRLSILQNQRNSNALENTNQRFLHRRNDIIRFGGLSKQNISAFNFSCPHNTKEVVSSNELLMSVSRIGTSGVCSTVHNEVIVCPNETKGHNDVNFVTEFESSCSTSEYTEAFEENRCDCQECQMTTTDLDVPCRNSNKESNISEDDQESIIEDADFASLPTVICNQKVSVQDTDSESVVTCMTQSTDLEKYLDCSIEYSSPDDGAFLSQSQSSNQRSISSRSNDASTATIINTESEQTLCISTMSELQDCEETSNKMDCTSVKMLSGDAMFDETTHNRAYSVDSYMEILKNCTKDLFLKKSLSEPSQQSAEHFQTAMQCSSFSEFWKIPEDVALNFPSSEDNKLELSSRDLSVKTSDTLSFDPELELNEVPERKHIRRNSYTLTHPSEALVMAHAKSQAELSCESLSNCSASEHTDESFNSAFKKEAVELVLPPVSDREKMYPVLKCSDTITDTTIHTSIFSHTNHLDKTEAVGSDECHVNNELVNLCSPNTSVPNIALEDIQICLDKATLNSKNESSVYENCIHTVNGQDTGDIQENLKIGQEAVKQKDNQDFLVMLFNELKESHQKRVNLLLEEQKIQWLKLQEEFKEQERTLMEKLNLSGITVPPAQSGNFPSYISVSDFESSDAYEPNSSNEIPGKLSSSDSNSTNLSSETETFQTVIQKDVDQTKIPTHPQTTGDGLFSNSISSAQINITDNINVCATNCSFKQKTIENQTVAVTTHQNTSNSCDNQCVCENECFKYSSKSDFTTHSNQHEHLDSKAISISHIDNGFFYSNGPLKNTSIQNSYINESNLPFELENGNLPVQQDRELVHKIPFNEHLGVQFLDTKACSSKKESFGQQGCTLNQMHNHVTDNSYLTIKQVVSNEDKKSNLNENYNSSPTKLKYSTKNNDVVSCSSNLTKISFDKPHLTTQSQEKNVIRKVPISQKLSVIPDVSTKAMKLVSTSLTNLKRKQTKEISPEMLKRFEKLPAFVKGYLTRRLFKTEHVQGLIQTMQETVVLMQNLSEELTLKGNSISERDMELYNQLLAQLLSTFEKVYDIFCTISMKEKMKIISESRELRLKKKALDKKQEASGTSLALDKQISSPHKPTSATIKRRKRSLVDSRTYTISDMKECRARARSTSSSKSHSVSPSRIYQSSIGVNLSRKTKNCVKPARIHPWK